MGSGWSWGQVATIAAGVILGLVALQLVGRML
jgi:hypothetical protein